MLCPCCSNKNYDACCQLFIVESKQPELAEQLMRSRYTAYALGYYDYVVNTYAQRQKEQLSVQDIAVSSTQQKWIQLVIHATNESDNIPTVEFSAFYLIGNQLFELREHSRFIKEDGYFKYTDGNVLVDKQISTLTRNDICPCESGKKFKKCCGR